MKSKLTSHKHFRTTVSLFFLAMVTMLFINACKKELLLGAESPTPAMLNKAKLFYSQQTTSLPKISSANQGGAGENTYNQELEEKKAPIWNEAKMEKTTDGRTVMTVPLNKNNLANKDIDYVRKYVFEERNGDITQGKIVEVIGATELIDEKGESTVTKYKDKQIEGFSGAVISYDLNYKYLEGYHYQKGRQVPSMVRIRAKPPETKATGGGKGKLASANIPNKISYEIGNDGQTQTCTNWYMVTSYYDQYGDFMYSTETYLGTTCSGPTGPVGPPPIGGGSTEIVRYDCAMEPNGEAYEADCGCIGGSTGIESCPPKEIIDSLTDKCIKNAKNIVITQNGWVNSLLRNFTSNNSFSPNYTWILKNKTLSDAELASTGNWDRVNKKVTTIIDETKFVNASDLAIVKTLLHEGIHAYLVAYFANDPLNANKEYSALFDAYFSSKRPDLNEIHHNEMARIFVDQIAISLREYGDSKGYTFSSSLEKERFYSDLSWGGLFESNAFKAMSTQEQDRIKNVISIEQKGENTLGTKTTPTGRIGGCQ